MPLVHIFETGVERVDGIPCFHVRAADEFLHNGQPELADWSKWGLVLEAKSQLQNRANPYELLFIGFGIIPPVSYTHLTLPTICSV